MSAFVPPFRITRERMSGALPAVAPHLRPLMLAVRDNWCAFGAVMQNQGAFAFGIEKPTIVLLGDDLDEALGPDAFHAKSVRRFVERCGLGVVVACEALPHLYAAAAESAILTRQNVVIVETQPAHEADWINALRRVKAGLPMLVGAVRPESGARH